MATVEGVHRGIQMKSRTAYSVTVTSTNACKTHFCAGENVDYECKEDVVIIVTDTPAEIFLKWGSAVRAVRVLGPAYIIEGSLIK